MLYAVALIQCRPRNKDVHRSTQQTAHIAACKVHYTIYNMNMSCVTITQSFDNSGDVVSFAHNANVCVFTLARCTPHVVRSSAQLQYSFYRVASFEAMIPTIHHVRSAPLGMPATGGSIIFPTLARGCGHGSGTSNQVPLTQLPVQSLGRPSLPFLPAIGGGGVCVPIDPPK